MAEQNNTRPLGFIESEKLIAAMLDNINYQLLDLNKTMVDVKRALQLIALKMEDKTCDKK